MDTTGRVTEITGDNQNRKSQQKEWQYSQHLKTNSMYIFRSKLSITYQSWLE